MDIISIFLAKPLDKPGIALYSTFIRGRQSLGFYSRLLGHVSDDILINCVRLQLHGAIYRPDLFVLMLRYCGNLKAIRYESTILNRIVADKSHRVIVA